jgi:integrase
MTKTLTTRFCSHVRPAESGSRLVWSDAVRAGLQFRVAGTRKQPIKSWSFLYRYHAEQRRAGLGRFPEISVARARELAGDILDQVEAGIDPREAKAAAEAAERAKEANTVEAAVDLFVDTYAAQRRWRDLEGILRNEAVAAWGSRPIASITRRDVMQRLDAIAARAPVRANRCLSVFRLFFKWARQREMIDTSPAADVDPLTVEKSRERILTDVEVAAFWRAADTKGWPFGHIYRLLLLTGCRRDEVGGLRWSEVDVDGRKLEIAGDRTKIGKPLVVPLSEPALEIVKALPRIGKSPYVFPSAKGVDRPASGYGKAKIILDDLMLAEFRKMAPDRDPIEVTLEPFVIHDLRRTCRSGLSQLQVPPDIAELAIGHQLTGVRKIYDRYVYLAERREALEKWGAHVMTLVAPPPMADRKVVRLRRR